MCSLQAGVLPSYHAQRFTLRSELVFTPQRYGSDVCYVVEDPVSSKFYRVGIREYELLCRLDGRQTVGEVLATVVHEGADSLTESEGLSIFSWLLQTGLLETERSPTGAPGPAVLRSRPAPVKPWNPIYLRLPLVHPDRWFEAARPWLSWLISWPAFALWALVVGVACVQLVQEWPRWSAASSGILAPGNWLWLLVCWVLLKFVHELAHGIACKRFGGTVREMGLYFVLFSPLAYVDVTSSWRFRSAWQRIFTAAAGMYAELFVAALALLVWSRTEPGLLNHVCHNLVIMASLTTILFNANPLMRYDGYFVLTDMLGIPNLSQRGQLHVRNLMRRWLVGIAAERPVHWSGKEILICFYGWMAGVWRVTVSVSILIAAAALFHGAGIILAVAALLLWVVVPTLEFLRTFVGRRSRPAPAQPVSRARLVATTLILGPLLALFLFATPWPLSVRAPAVVEFAPHSVVRTASDGFVREVFVRDHQLVESGQPLARLVNDQLELERHDLQLQIRQSELRCRIYQRSNELAAYQAEQQKLRSLELKLAERQGQVDALTIRAPLAGMVTRRDLDTIVGTFLKAGSEILSIGDPTKKELRVAVAQDDLEHFTAQVGSTVKVRLSGRLVFSASLGHVMPRASLQSPHFALCAAAGGPLPVRPTDSKSEHAASGDFELLAPRFIGVVPLGPEQSTPLLAGQTGTVSLQTSVDAIGPHLANLVYRWVQDKFRQQSQGG